MLGRLLPGCELARLESLEPSIKALAINLLTQGIGAGLSFVILPLTARTLGLDAFGLLGIAATVQMLVFVLDGCNLMTRLVARELGNTDTEPTSRIRAVFGTSERLYAGVFAAGVALTVCLTFPLSAHIAESSSITIRTLNQSLTLIAVGAFVKLQASFYRGCVVGMHAQLPANLIALTANVVRFPVAYFSTLITPDIRIFLGIQLLSFAFEAAMLRAIFNRLAPAKPLLDQRSELALLRPERKFIATTFALSAATVTANQVDKILLASTLGSAEFGAASLAILLCGGLFVLATPIHQLFLPRLARASHVADSGAPAQTSAAGRAVSASAVATLLCVGLPVALTLATGAPSIAKIVAPHSGPSVAVIADALLLWGLGNCVGVVASALYLVYFASGQVARYGKFLLVYLAVYMPLAWASLRWGGMQGAGTAWLVGNLMLTAALALDLRRRQWIGPSVPVMLTVAALLVGVSIPLGGIIQPFLPSTPTGSAGWVMSVCLVSLTLTVRALMPALRPSADPLHLDP